MSIDKDKLNPRPSDPQSCIATVWEALDHAREQYSDDEWDKICMAMAWLTEDLGFVKYYRVR
jgi:hypothetical protein